MYDEQTKQNAPLSKRLKVLLVISVLALFVLIAFLVWGNSSGDNRVLFSTGTQANQNFGYLDGYNLYDYNGLVFRQLNYETGEESSLYTGFKLPDPRQVYWAGSQGTLMTFQSSFLLSDVHDALKDMGLELNSETRNYAWYLDFSDGELRMVSSVPVQPGSAFYSAESGGFFYVVLADNGTALNFYDIDKNENTVLNEGLGLVDMSYMGSCDDAPVCAIARQQKDPVYERLFSIGSDGSVNEIYNSKGRMFATSRPDRFVVVENTESGEDTASDEEIEFGTQTAELLDTKDMSVTALGFDVAGSEITVSFVSDEDYFVLDNQAFNNASRKPMSYRLGSISGFLGLSSSSEKQLVRDNGEPFTGGITTNVSFGSGGDALITDFNNTQYLFTGEQVGENISFIGRGEAQNNLDTCNTDNVIKNIDYFAEDRLFKVYLNNDSGLNDNIRTIADCLSQTNTRGYNYYFGALDPRNGRLVTD